MRRAAEVVNECGIKNMREFPDVAERFVFTLVAAMAHAGWNLREAVVVTKNHDGSGGWKIQGTYGKSFGKGKRATQMERMFVALQRHCGVITDLGPHFSGRGDSEEVRDGWTFHPSNVFGDLWAMQDERDAQRRKKWAIYNMDRIVRTRREQRDYRATAFRAKQRLLTESLPKFIELVSALDVDTDTRRWGLFDHIDRELRDDIRELETGLRGRVEADEALARISESD